MNFWRALANSPESERLDYAVREHEKLERRFSALIDLLLEKELITHDEAVRLRSQESN